MLILIIDCEFDKKSDLIKMGLVNFSTEMSHIDP